MIIIRTIVMINRRFMNGTEETYEKYATFFSIKKNKNDASYILRIIIPYGYFNNFNFETNVNV